MNAKPFPNIWPFWVYYNTARKLCTIHEKFFLSVFEPEKQELRTNRREIKYVQYNGVWLFLLMSCVKKSFIIQITQTLYYNYCNFNDRWQLKNPIVIFINSCTNFRSSSFYRKLTWSNEKIRCVLEVFKNTIARECLKNILKYSQRLNKIRESLSLQWKVEWKNQFKKLGKFLAKKLQINKLTSPLSMILLKCRRRKSPARWRLSWRGMILRHLGVSRLHFTLIFGFFQIHP